MGTTIDHADWIGRVREIMRIQTPDATVNKAVLADIFHLSPRDSRMRKVDHLLIYCYRVRGAKPG